MPLQMKALPARGAEFIPSRVLRPNLAELNRFVGTITSTLTRAFNRDSVIYPPARGLAGILIKKFFHYRLSRR